MDIAVSLHLDFETRSRVDLKERGLDNYAKDPSTEVLILAYAVNDQAPQIWFPHERPMPEELLLLLKSPSIAKFAFNVGFERAIFLHVLGIDIPVEQWHDPSTNSKYASIAGNLEFVGKVLGLPADKAKLATGKKLIKLFCSPNKKGEFNDWNSHPTEWADFCEYARQDVNAEREIHRKLKAFALPPLERKIWKLDQAINERGIPSDKDFVRNAALLVTNERDNLTKEMRFVTSLENPNSVKQMLEWVKTQGYPYGSLGKKWVEKAIEGISTTETGKYALGLRQSLSKSSTSKLEAIKNLAGPDGNLRHQYVYGGAARTLRWSGRGFQPHNLPRGTVKDVNGAVEAILAADEARVRKFGNPLEVVSSCLRSALRAPKGKHFVVCDLKAIENIGLGWSAGCPGILNVFERGLDPYVDFGTKLFKKTYEELDPEVDGLPEHEVKTRKDTRQLCKPAVLGCGYGLGAGKDDFDKNGDEIKTGLYGYAAGMDVDIDIEQSAEMVNIFRTSYPEVPTFWRQLDNAALNALRTGEKQQVGHFTFGAVKPLKLLYLILPSGRRLHYIRPNISMEEKWNGDAFAKISYEGNIIGSHWGRIPTWGGKFCENIVQAWARDVLADSMLRATEEGFTIVAHTHDEIICLEDVGSSLNLAKLQACMMVSPIWAPDVKLGADGFEDEIYRKN